MTPDQALNRLREVVRRKHFALSTEQAYCHWLVRFMAFLPSCPKGDSSEEKVEAFLSSLARSGVSASTQNQAFNALVFFYRAAVGIPLGNVDALRAKRPAQIRQAPTVEETWALLAAVKDVHGYPTRLIVHLLYGSGLRVSEPLNLRIRDVCLRESRLLIRAAKGGKDRVVALPCSLAAGIRDQIESARVTWKRDVAAGLPVALPGLLAKKYPRSAFAWEWAWLFPSHSDCVHPRTGERVRWRCHEANVQRAVRAASGGAVKPHELRHGFATHSLNRGVNPRAIQQVMGHASLETTMGYLHAEVLSVPSPLDLMT